MCSHTELGWLASGGGDASAKANAANSRAITNTAEIECIRFFILWLFLLGKIRINDAGINEAGISSRRYNLFAGREWSAVKTVKKLAGLLVRIRDK